jgi:hypothetical protein
MLQNLGERKFTLKHFKFICVAIKTVEGEMIYFDFEKRNLDTLCLLSLLLFDKVYKRFSKLLCQKSMRGEVKIRPLSLKNNSASKRFVTKSSYEPLRKRLHVPYTWLSTHETSSTF